jgi:acyl carrier protein
MSSTSAKDVRAFVLNYLSERAATGEFDANRIGNDFDFLEAGIIDSLGIIEMIAEMEKHFQIRVDFVQTDPEELTVLEPFSRYVARNAVADVGSVKT